MEYQQRTYRDHLKEGRWRSFTCKVKETDLWIGVDTASYQPEMVAFTEEIVRRLREEMETYLATDKEYTQALCPYTPDESAPAILQEMATAARQAGIGPMSAVAGAMAQRVGQAIRQRFATREVIVENGGDIYADIREDMDIAVFAQFRESGCRHDHLQGVRPGRRLCHGFRQHDTGIGRHPRGRGKTLKRKRHSIRYLHK